eukprot:1012725-Amphidinium_carterae.3
MSIVEVNTLALAVSKAAAVAKCSCTNAGAPKGKGASDQAVARMPTKCSPRPQSAFGRLNAEMGASQSVLQCLPGNGSLTGMHGENSIINIGSQLCGWWHMRRSQLRASKECERKEGSGKRIPLNESSMRGVERLRGSCKPRRAWRCVTQKGTVDAGKGVLQIHLNRAMFRILPHCFAHSINKLGRRVGLSQSPLLVFEKRSQGVLLCEHNAGGNKLGPQRWNENGPHSVALLAQRHTLARVQRGEDLLVAFQSGKIREPVLDALP